jgi:hypothetical protein
MREPGGFGQDGLRVLDQGIAVDSRDDTSRRDFHLNAAPMTGIP